MTPGPDPNDEPIPLTPTAPADTPTPIRPSQTELPPRVRCPATVIIAGIIWLLLCLGFIGSAINGFVVSSAGTSVPVSRPTAAAGQKINKLSDGTSDVRLILFIEAMVALPLVLLFAVLGIFALSGSAPRVLVSGILSVVVGAGKIASTVALLGGAGQETIALGLSITLGVTAVASGVLALVGNGQFIRWKASQKELAIRRKLDTYNAKIAAEPEDTEIDRPPLPVKKVLFPSSVQMAAAVWCVVGLLQLGSVILTIAVYASGNSGLGSNSKPVRPDLVRPQPQPQARPQTQTPKQQDESQAAVSGMICGAAFGLLIAAAFGITGLQTLKGSVSSVTGAGVASLFLGLLGVAGAIALLLASERTAAQGGISLLTVFLLLVSGIGAVAGGKQYKQWRKWRKEQEAFRKMNLPKFGRSGP